MGRLEENGWVVVTVTALILAVMACVCLGLFIAVISSGGRQGVEFFTVVGTCFVGLAFVWIVFVGVLLAREHLRKE